MARIDYDAIAHLYDSQPFRTKEADPHLGDLLRTLSTGERASVRALDLGCGTGNQQAANLASFPEVKLFGADLFRGMLKQAAGKTRQVRWLQCDGIALPFRAGTFHYVSNQFSLHHVKDKRRLMAEVLRVLRPGGRFVLQNICPERMRESAQYRYFPESAALDERDFLKIAELKALCREVGFADVCAEVNVRRWERPLPLWAQELRRRDLNSSLQAVSDEGYAQGLKRIDEDLARGVYLVKDEVALVTLVARAP